MCKKNITQPFEFFCYTDDPSNIEEQVNIIPFVDHNLDIIVHNKLFLFSEYVDRHIGKGDRVFFDLDIVIKSNIDHIVTYNKGEITLIKAVWRIENPRGFPLWHHLYNSSCMTWRSPENQKVWEHYEKNKEFFLLKYHGGMDSFLSYEQKQIKTKIHNFPNTEECFYSHIYGRIFHESELALEVYQKTAFLCWPERFEKIPIVLLNGFTTKKDYETYRKYYED